MAQILTLMRSYGLPVAGLGLSATLAAASVGFAWASAFGSLDEPTRPRTTAGLAAVPPSLSSRAEDLTPKPELLLAKPLFSPTRRPPMKIAPPPEPPAPIQIARAEPPPAPAYTVGGVVLSPRFRKVLLRTPDGASGRWFKEGEKTAEGWTINGIQPDGVMLAQSDRKLTLVFRVGGRWLGDRSDVADRQVDGNRQVGAAR